MEFAYSVSSDKAFDQVERAVRDAAAAKGMRVLHVHDVQKTFAEKGIAREPYKIIEICNVRYANQALTGDPMIGLMMPCKVNVFTEQSKTKIALLLPSLLAEFYPHANLGGMARELETLLRDVVDTAK
jgi:uncharacterized protein (DUF302 family)